MPSLPYPIIHAHFTHNVVSFVASIRLTIENFVVRWWSRWGLVWTCWLALSLLSEPISVFEVNGEHKTYLKATFTTWLIPLHCVISRCHISPPHVCLNAPPSSLWLVRLYWLPKFTCSMTGIAHNLLDQYRKKIVFTSTGLNIWYSSFYISDNQIGSF